MLTQKFFVGISVIMFLICVQMAETVSAYETPNPFKITKIFISSANNRHFRVYSNSPGSWLCADGPIYDSWAYIEEADSGAKAKIATLLTAYTLGKTVSLTTEGIYWSGIKYCHIVEFSISD